jgi:hypothetical protein
LRADEPCRPRLLHRLTLALTSVDAHVADL